MSGPAKTPPEAAPVFQYLKLADSLERKIADGDYRAGEKLPSLRALRSGTGLSITTIYKAYVELEGRGLVETKEKSGFFVRPRLDCLLPGPEFRKHRARPRKVAVNALAEAIQEATADGDMLPLGAAVPASELLPVRQLAASTRTMAGRYLQSGGLSYGPAAGVPELRRQIVRRSVWAGCDEEELVVTSGCLDAIALCLRATAKAGDTIIVESPTFLCYLQLIEDLNMLVLELPTDPERGIDYDLLAEAVERNKVAACILTPNFQNPLGFEMEEVDKKRLVDFLGGKEIPIIEDDVYGELHFGQRRPATLKSFDSRGLVLYCSSFSKALAPDLRVGWTMPGRYADKVKRLKFNTTIASPKLNQLVVADFLASGSYDRHLRKLGTKLKNQVANTARAVARHFPEGTRISAPKGGYVLWVQLPEWADGLGLFEEAKRRKIFILPGAACSTTADYSNCIRISCGEPWSEKLEEGIRTLGDIVEKMKGETSHG